MFNYIKDMFSNSANASSARVINFMGAINGGMLLAYETYKSGLSADLLGVYLAYCGGVYTAGKYFGGKDVQSN